MREQGGATMWPVGVDCRFAMDGTVDVRRVYLDGQWQTVGQGRQWVDGAGRHVLIMLPGSQPREILLSAQTMTWQLLPPGPARQVV
jgi:hypothetical protein